MSDSLVALMNFFFTTSSTLCSIIIAYGYTLFEYLSSLAFTLVREIYHLSSRLNGPGWSSDFLRLFQMGGRVEVTSRLNTWQYWWWFWFCFAWAYYDGFFKRLLCIRNFRVFIGIYTSLRPHGKFGDFIACIIPIGWVINIVFNSNSLLKLAEWQNDSTVFNIRIRARQWYWLYYYDFKHIFEVFTLPKQIGWNSWRCDGFGVTKYYSSYITAVESRSRDFANAFDYWDEKISDVIKNNYLKKQRVKNYSCNKLAYESCATNNTSFNEKTPIIRALSRGKKVRVVKPTLLSIKKVPYQLFTKKLNLSKQLEFFYIKRSLLNKEISRKFFEYRVNYSGLLDLSIIKIKKGSQLEDDSSKELLFSSEEGSIKKKNRKLIFDSLSPDTFDSFYFDKQKSTQKVFDVKLNIQDSVLKFITKIYSNQHLGLEWWDNRGLVLLLQKRLESPDIVPADFFTSTQKIDYRLSAESGARHYINLKTQNYMIQDKFLTTTDLNVVNHNKFTRNSTKVSYHLPTQFSKRLLRVTKTFILPTLTSLNVMTNSYDVVHSWFIPGLGIKFDCVPGKSTHHLLYIEYVGFFYGQCAEICGRYHHHMPVRIYACTLSYFMSWWSHIGFFKALSLNPYNEFKLNSTNTSEFYLHEEPYWVDSRSNFIW